MTSKCLVIDSSVATLVLSSVKSVDNFRRLLLASGTSGGDPGPPPALLPLPLFCE